MTQRARSLKEYAILAVLVPVAIAASILIVMTYSMLGFLVSFTTVLIPRVRFRWPHSAALDVFMKSAGFYIGKKLGEEVVQRG